MNQSESNPNQAAALAEVDPKQSFHNPLLGAWWTRREASEHVGVSLTTIHEWLHSGIGNIFLKRMYVGREVRISPTDLSEFICATSAYSGKRRPACVGRKAKAAQEQVEATTQ